MKKVLLLDTNVSSFPIYNFLLKMGYDVYVAGLKPSDCLAKLTNNYINFDYSNEQDLNSVIKDYKFDFIVPGCNDVSYLSASKVNKNNLFFGIDTENNTEIINNKLKFREFAIKNKMHVPLIFTEAEVSKKNIPIIVKPVDAYSGRGVTVIKDNNKNNLQDAIEKAKEFSKSKNYIIEEYVDGQLYSHSAFVKNKKIFIDFFVIENGTANDFTVDTSFVVNNFSSKIAKSIRKDIEMMCEKLDLVDGLIHTQFIKTKNSFKIVEITRRCPGDLYSLLIEKSTGFKYSEYYTIPFIKENMNDNNVLLDKNYFLRHTISLKNDSEFIGLSYNNSLNMDLFIPMSLNGDFIEKSPFSRIGLVFLKVKSNKELKKLYNSILNRTLYTLYK